MINKLCDSHFRKELVSAIKTSSPAYTLPQKIPTLYKFSGFSKYSIENIINDGFSMSLVSSFNDSHDSKLSFGDLKMHAIEENLTDSMLAINAGCEPCITQHEWLSQLIEEQKAYRSFLSDSYCVCFSEKADSTLMWSHYSDNNRGICIAYDFEKIKTNPMYYSLLPVCYTDVPIDIYDFAHEKRGENSIELGLLISLLNKSFDWRYEYEWRMFCFNSSLSAKKLEKYLTLKDIVPVQGVILGQNFIDNFIPELSNFKNEGKTAVELFETLVNHCKTKKIPIYIMTSVQNSFKQNVQETPNAEDILNFIKNQIENKTMTMRYRESIYESLSKILNASL